MNTPADVSRKGVTISGVAERWSGKGRGSRTKGRTIGVSGFANAMIGWGCGKGDRLTIPAENTHTYIEVYGAAAMAGMSMTPLNFGLSHRELTHIVNDREGILYIHCRGGL